MTAPIQLNTYIPKEEDPNRENNLARMAAIKRGITPSHKSTVFTFGGNPALGVFDPKLTVRKFYNPKAVQIVPPKREVVQLALQPVPTQTPPSVIEVPPRPATPPPAPPKELTSPEKVIRAAKALTEITNTERQGFKIRKQMRVAAEKRKVDALPTPPQAPKKARASSSITQNESNT